TRPHRAGRPIAAARRPPKQGPGPRPHDAALPPGNGPTPRPAGPRADGWPPSSRMRRYSGALTGPVAAASAVRRQASVRRGHERTARTASPMATGFGSHTRPVRPAWMWRLTPRAVAVATTGHPAARDSRRTLGEASKAEVIR